MPLRIGLETFARRGEVKIWKLGRTRMLVCCMELSLLFCVAGCGRRETQPAATQPAHAEPALKAAPPTPIAEKKEELGGTTWDPAWDALVERALPPSLGSARAARAVAGFCPRFARESEADKRAFWAYFFQALAGAEAGLDPTTTVRHTEPVMQRTDRVTHRPVRQEGLLQLSYDDDLRYGCNFDWQHDRGLELKDARRTILDPGRNLACGVHIVENQIIRQGKPLVTRSSYFSTLQPGTTSFAVFHKQMANVPAACGVGVLKPAKQTPHRRVGKRSAGR